MGAFLHLYLLVALGLILIGLVGFLVYELVGRRLSLVATFLFGAGGERRHLLVLDFKLRALRWLVATVARYEQRRAGRWWR